MCSSDLSPPPPRAVKRGRSVVLTDGIIMSLATKSELVKKLPFFRFPKELGKPGGCGCRKKSIEKGRRAAWFQKIKRNVLSLPDNKKAILKAALNIEHIHLYIKQRNKVDKYTV